MNPNSQKAKRLADDLAAMDTYKDHSEYCWSHHSEIVAALRAQQDGPSERDAVLEEAATLCEELGINADYKPILKNGNSRDEQVAFDHGDRLAQRIRALKNAAPQQSKGGTGRDPGPIAAGAAPQQSAGADGMKLVPQSAVSLAWSLIKERRDALFVSVRLLEEYEEALKTLSRAGFDDHLPTLMELRGILKDDPSGATDSEG